jgi:hypothetical protein
LSRCSFGAVLGTAQKYGSARRWTKSGAGVLRWIVSVCPDACHERTSRRYVSAGETSSGERARSNVRANDAAVTGVPSLNCQPERRWNVYVSRSGETVGNAVATSGTSFVPR